MRPRAKRRPDEAGEPISQELIKLNIPVLLVCGQYDEATPETVKKYHKMIKSSEFKVVKNASHCLSVEQPKELIRAIKAFID